MKTTESDLDQISIFDKMKITPHQKHELDKLGNDLFNTLNTIYFYARSVSSTLENKHFYSPENDPKKQSSDDKLAHMLMNASRNVAESFYAFAVKASDGNELAAHDAVADTIIKFAEYSQNNYSLRHVVPRDTLDSFMTKKMLEDAFELFEKKGEILKDLSKIHASQNTTGLPQEYMKALIKLMPINDANIQRSIYDTNQSLQIKGDKIPNSVITHVGFEELATKFNIRTS